MTTIIAYTVALVSTSAFIALWFWVARRELYAKQKTVDAAKCQLTAKAIGYTTPKVHAENTFADSAKISAYAADGTSARDAVKQMQMAGVLAGKSSNNVDPQGIATRAEASAVLRRFVELAISGDNMQGWTMNDSGQWMYYVDGRPVTAAADGSGGKRDIDGVNYTFDR